MPLTRVYYSGELSAHQEIVLPAAASHHMLTVLRLSLGDTLVIFNGSGLEYNACLKQVIKKSVIVLTGEALTIRRESPLSIALGQAISRGDRMDYAIQKAVELGVASITPIFTARCQVKLTPDRVEKRLAHWQGIIIAASEQSGRLVLPTLKKPLSLADWLSCHASGFGVLCSPCDGVAFLPQSIASNQVNLLIGPEGGFNDGEINSAVNAGYHRLQLGPRILRTETATVVALTRLQTQWGDML